MTTVKLLDFIEDSYLRIGAIADATMRLEIKSELVQCAITQAEQAYRRYRELFIEINSCGT